VSESTADATVTSTSLTWLGHSTVVIDIAGTRLVTDPLLGRHAGLLRRRGARPPRTAWERPDAVLLSHLHHDHAELASLRRIPGEVPVITAPDNASWLRRRGLHGVSPGADGWIDVGDGHAVSVALCRADHGSRPMPHRPNAANGHLIRSSDAAIWVAGDTSLFPAMAELRHDVARRIDLAIVPVSGWGPRLSPGHLGPVEAAEACALVGARFAVPVHWGTLHAPGVRNLPRGWMDRPAREFVAAVSRVAPQCTPVVLRHGARTALDLS
jgi:L-ascorbate metabolism protein UlaG (beta-lactamase superfamily)